jgi:large subunit ribosomal protein L5
MARLKKFYKENVINKLQKQLNLKNIMQVPKLSKITLNIGSGEISRDKKVMKFILDDLQTISGQKAVQTLARKSIAGFKIRQDFPIGAKVTLRGNRMYEFFDRLISITIPRIRDFRGFNLSSFDGRGNYSLGIKEQISFPEIDYDKVDSIRGLDITITTTARDNIEAEALLRAFNFPLKQKDS